MAGVRINRHKLRLLRQVNGLTQAGLAEAAGISAGYLSHLESGRRETVAPPVYVRICDSLAVQDRTELMDLDEDRGGQL